MKSCKQQIFISFRDLQLLFWSFLHPRLFEKIQISNLTNSNVVFHDKMISNEKVVNYKVLELIEIYNFYFGHFSIELCLNNSKFKFQKMTTSNKILK